LLGCIQQEGASIVPEQQRGGKGQKTKMNDNGVQRASPVPDEIGDSSEDWCAFGGDCHCSVSRSFRSSSLSFHSTLHCNRNAARS
jgi:hypothetical protein